METRWMYRTSGDLKELLEASKGVCLLPFGCVEKHGPHLPLGTDTLAVDAISYAASQIEPVCVFPPFIFGDLCGAAPSMPHGTVTLREETMLFLLEELCDQISRAGFRKILLCGSHGGNTNLAGYFLRAQCYNKKGYATMYCKAYDLGGQLKPANILAAAKANPDYFSMLTEEDYETLERFSAPDVRLGHACFGETALIYGTYPDLVAPDRYDAESGASTHRADYLTNLGVSYAYAWPSNYPESYAGTAPHGCSRTIGEAAVKLSVDRLTHIFEVIRDDEECVAMAKDGFPG